MHLSRRIASILSLDIQSIRSAILLQRISPSQARFISSSSALSAQHTVDTNMGRQQRERLVVVGSGWVGLYLAQYVNTDKYHVSIVSPNRTSPYTPLLASAAVALVPFRYAEESIRSKGRDVRFLEANVTAVDMQTKSISCEAAFEDDPHLSSKKFDLPYDKLVLAPGCR
jgi:hypothetical protein